MNTKYIYLILIFFTTLPTVAQLGGPGDGILIGPDGDKITYYRDADGDGYGNNNTLSLDIKYAPTSGYVSNHTDCDDTKASINPGITWYRDIDGDGYGTNSITKKQCYQPSGYVSAGGDYNDGNALITNIAPRNFYRDADGDSYGDYSVKTYRSVRPNGYVTNNKDCNDSNASLNLLKTWYRDSDGDGYGSEYLGSIVIGQAPRQSCAQPSGYVLNKLDCNDSNAAIRPNTVWYRDADGDGYGIASSTKTGCSVGLGYVLNKLDCNDSNASLNPNTVWYRDADNDGWGNKNVTKKQCSRPSGYVSNDDDYNDGTNLITNIAPRNFYRDADNDSFGHPTNKTYRSTRPNGYVTNSSDCNDNSAAINPNTLWYRDADGDGFGNSSVTKKQCTQPSGYVLNDDDLNDSNSLITTITPMHFYRDADNDTFGNPANSKYQSIQPSGYVVNSSDCNDNDSSLNPNTRWYRDADNDGWGNASVLKKQCTQPSGYVRNNDDYDDNNNLITNIAPRTFYADSDLDTYGNPSASIYRSVQPGSYVTNNSDCNDNDAAINPNTKWYRDADADGWGNASVVKTQCVQPSGYVRNDDDNDDSNNLITNITPSNFYRDADQDTFGTNTDKKYQSTQPSGYVTDNRDCDDSNASINPNTVWYVDNDGDGWGNRLVTKTQCTQPVGYVENNTDVDDTTTLITNLTPSTFYKDTDNDGFGEPDNTILASLQPVGYVGNSLDQCPDEMGNYGGCISRPYNNVVFSDENYVFTRAYQAPMQSSSAIKYDKDVIESITYFDGLGRAKQQIGINASAISFNTINNELPMDWAEGSGSTAFFNQNGATAENHRIRDVDPRGERSLVWRCGNDEYNNADGGWNTDYFAVDKNVGYRYSVWVKRTGSQNGATYHGTQNVNNLSGTANNNPYFWASDLPELDTWYMVVGVIHPYQYGGGNTGVSGVYDINGNKVLNGHEFKWRDNTTTSRFRSYLYYSTDVLTRQYFWKPLVQKLDGTQTSLADIFKDLNRNPKDIVSHIEYDQYGRTTKSYLPYAADGNKGEYRDSALEALQGFYNTNKYQHTLNPYSETIVDQSPANRVQEQAAPGNIWEYDSSNVTYENPTYTSYPITTSYAKFWEAHKLFAIAEGSEENNEGSPPNLSNNYVRITINNGVLTLDIKAIDKDAINTLPTGRLDRLDIYPIIKSIDLGAITDASGNPTHYKAGIENNYFVITKTSNNPAPTGGLISVQTYDLTQIQILTDYEQVVSGNATVKSGYALNVANEVARFDVVITGGVPALVSNGYYPSGELTKVISKDQNWAFQDQQNRTTEVFTNKSGQSLLQRSYNNDIAHDTYSVYDDFGNLTFVIPPKVDITNGVSVSELAELCYQYRYDQYNRLIEKKIPGKGWEYIIYNRLDQPVMVQDANQRAASVKKWMFTKYDTYGRVAYTGTIIDSRNRQEIQQEVTALTAPLWVEKGSEVLLGGVGMYYNNDGYPNVQGQNAEVLTINYYDDYNFLSTESSIFNRPDQVYEKDLAIRTKSLATGSKQKTLGTNDWSTSVTYYDTQGRSVYAIVEDVYLNSINKVKYKLDFVGKVIESTTTHIKDTTTPIVTVATFEYDHMGRVLNQKQTIQGNSEEVVVENTYDELSALQSKTVGGGLQTVDYTYNIRGWLTSINTPDQLGNDLFALQLHYNDPLQNGTALYNGNISAISWRTANDDTTRSYMYEYDTMNRITSAIDNSGRYNLYGVSYDKNGNILTLKRNGNTNTAATSFGAMDDLVYTYADTSNELVKVKDYAASGQGFIEGVDIAEEYTYDVNGNMITDRNKQIADITYNYYNLPTQVTTSTGTITYVYNASGAKVKKIVTQGNNTITTEYDGSYVYKNGQLEHFGHSEGYIEPDGNGNYSYIYQFTDHLGNIRLSYSDRDGDGRVDVLRNNIDVDGDSENDHEILAENNYYPFGLQHKGYNNQISGREHNYKYNGTELTEDLGYNMYEMPLRAYDPAIARWNRIDPVVHHGLSPYNAFDNNPVFYADPSGADSWGLSGGNHYGGFDGSTGSSIFWGSGDSFQNSGLDTDDFSFYGSNVREGLAAAGFMPDANNTPAPITSINGDSNSAIVYAEELNHDISDEEWNAIQSQQSCCDDLPESFEAWFSTLFNYFVTSNEEYEEREYRREVFFEKAEEANEVAEIYLTGMVEVGTLPFGGVGKTQGIKQFYSQFRWFTKGNYRFNLKLFTNSFGKGKDAHHIFPQKFEDFFNGKMINIHHPEFMTWWQKNSHRRSAKEFNDIWEGYIQESLHGGNFKRQEVLDFGFELMRNYGF
ncbi:DUF6443 domain-containing protein [uncultured Aquimarina sp.]|uniref:DUF6443 domain-containing protein n=1 Tax=uncultured Aquimarina sp. TaxID=575652 RepID=UPI00260BBE15|nr:DUF6443 domain-containing protein [uncultured Aquimarina sp.]